MHQHHLTVESFHSMSFLYTNRPNFPRVFRACAGKTGREIACNSFLSRNFDFLFSFLENWGKEKILFFNFWFRCCRKNRNQFWNLWKDYKQFGGKFSFFLFFLLFFVHTQNFCFVNLFFLQNKHLIYFDGNYDPINNVGSCDGNRSGFSGSFFNNFYFDDELGLFYFCGRGEMGGVFSSEYYCLSFVADCLSLSGLR